MRILHVDETFHPCYGYHCNPLAKFQRRQGNDVSIVTVEGRHLYPVYREFGEDGSDVEARDREYTESTGVEVARVPARGYLAGRLVYEYGKLFGAIEKAAPDAVMVHCLETLTAMRVLAKYDGKYPMVFDSHMLAMASRNRLARVYEAGFRALVTPRLVRGGYLVVKTQDDGYVTDRLGVPEDQTEFISFGTDTELFSPDDASRRRFRREAGLGEDAFVVVSTGKMTEAKGGMLFAEAVRRRFSSRRPVALVVVANFDGEYGGRVRKALGESENRVVFYPVQRYADLPRFYQAADAAVFPRQCSLSFYDAQACGVPVISEDNAINLERNSHGNGVCFEGGDAESLRGAIARLADSPAPDLESMKRNARRLVLGSYGYEGIAKRYTDALERAVRRKNSRD